MFKKLVSVLMCFFLLTALMGCGQGLTTRNGNGKVQKYEQIGLFELNEWQDDKNIRYEVVWGNVVWSVILIETIFVPLILLGWYLYEPVPVES